MRFNALATVLIALTALCWTSWPNRLARALGRAIASVVLLSLIASCASSRKATEVSNTWFQGSSVETRDTVREQVMVAVHDTIREITTITVQTNETGDTVKVVQITDRDRARAREAVRDKEERLAVKTDTVYIEKRDSVFVQTDTNLTNPTNKKPGFLTYLKWIFALICAITVLIITIKVCLRRI